MESVYKNRAADDGVCTQHDTQYTTMSTMGTIARGDEMEAQRRYPTPALFICWPAGVEDGAELDVAGAAEEIELSNWAGTGLITSRRRPGTRLGEKGLRSWSRMQSSGGEV